MILTPEIWLKWASVFMPEHRSSWLEAMSGELYEIDGEKERRKFAIGCFASALGEWPKSRKGLSQLSRLTGAVFLMGISSMGLIQSYVMRGSIETAEISKFIAFLCCVYLGAAILLLTSLKTLKLFSLAGVLTGGMFWLYSQHWIAGTELLPNRFLTALSFEATGMMLTLFLATVYLGWLYDPNFSEAE